MLESKKSITVLVMSTLAFTVCFAVWTMNGVLITFLSENRILVLEPVQIGWVMGVPVLTGAITRLPVGMLTDRYGGRWVFVAIMLLSAVPAYLMSFASTYEIFLLASLGFGLAGASFAVGIAYTSVWFRKEQQGTALGIFGAGNAGASLTSLGAPRLLEHLTNNGANLDGWRSMPQIYAAGLVAMAVLFALFTHSRSAVGKQNVGWLENLKPLKSLRVWRFGLYYFLVFGGFVALAQWLIPYYVNVYAVTLVTAGMLAAMFSLPSGVIRAIGGYMSDRWGARSVMYVIMILTLVASIMLVLPPMDIQTPGQGVMASEGGIVSAVSEKEIVVGNNRYSLQPRSAVDIQTEGEHTAVLPQAAFWQEPVVAPGDRVNRRQLLARGITYIHFQANIWVFTGLVFLVGVTTGIGKAAVYKHIAVYFPNDVGVVGGMVGVIGALGGFFLPIFFGYLVGVTGLWTTTWLFLAILTVVSLGWMHGVVTRMMGRRVPDLVREIEEMGWAEPALGRRR